MKKTCFALVLAAALLLGACGGPAAPGNAPNKLTVGATPTPHAEILEFIKPALLKAGYELDIVVVTDYILPNTALEAGDLDANFFQHLPYLLSFNEENGTDLVSVIEVHFEPMGLYAGRSADLSNAPDGAEIGVPSDTTNEARALQLLAAQGLITLPDGIGLTATPSDIIDNPKNLKFFEAEAALLPRALADLDFAVINGNYAIDAGIVDKVIVMESGDSTGAQLYANIIAVKAGNENAPGILALAEAITSAEVREFIESNYGGYVVPIF